MRERKPEDWVVVKHNHEPIIDELMFAVVQKMMQRDTRTSPDQKTVQMLGGLLFCPDCKRAMCRRVVTRGKKKFYYYVCSTNKHGKGCSSHSISEEKLELVVLHAIQGQIQSVAEMETLLQQISSGDLQAIKMKRLDIQITQKEQEINRYEAFRMKLYESMTEGLVDREEYQQMRHRYSQQINTAGQALRELEQKRKKLEEESEPNRAWMEQVLQYRNIAALNRQVVITLIDKIYVYAGREVHIDFNFRDEMAEICDLLDAAKKEAV